MTHKCVVNFSPEARSGTVAGKRRREDRKEICDIRLSKINFGFGRLCNNFKAIVTQAEWAGSTAGRLSVSKGFGSGIVVGGDGVYGCLQCLALGFQSSAQRGYQTRTGALRWWGWSACATSTQVSARSVTAARYGGLVSAAIVREWAEGFLERCSTHLSIQLPTKNDKICYRMVFEKFVGFLLQQ